VRDRFDRVDVERLRRRQTVKWTLYGPDVLAAWVAEMDFDTAPVVRAAVVDAVEREDFGYVVADVSPLTTACSGFFERAYGWSVPPARVFLVADVLVGIAAALDAFIAPGVDVVVPTPAYPPFFEVIALTGRRPVAAPMVVDGGRDVLDLDAIEGALRQGAKAVLLCNPHNPTGRVFTRTELEALAALADRHGARVIADEVHAPLVHAPTAQHVPYATVSDGTAAHTVTVTSASKAFNLAGLKCAQVVTSNHDDATRWRALLVHEVPGPTPLGIAASTAAYRDGDDWLHALVAYLGDNRRRLGELVAGLAGVTWHEPEATFLAWLDCSATGLADPARFFLDDARVAVSDGPPFGPGCASHVRLNFATSRALLERIVDAMANALAQRDGR
jgi:cystathionine beta-lyase